ncbi:MAG: threonine/serine dehydratase [Longimicrobiales bacterium]
MVSLNDIQQARASAQGRIPRTPLFGSTALSQRVGARVLLKAEFLQKTGSFKVRGVLHKISRLSPQQKAAGLISVSAGNHAQALAFGASAEGVRSTIVMPATASPLKVQASREYGAEIILHGNAQEAFTKMDELQRQHGYTLVHPYDDDDIIAGHGTAGLEIMEDHPAVDVVVVPVGGGGLISGVAAAVKQCRPAARVYGVEPTGAATLRKALDAGRVVKLDSIQTIADGLAAPMSGERVLEHVHAFVDDVVLVTDDEIKDALRFVLQRCKFLLEPAGAAAVAALMVGRIPLPPGAQVVAVASGGNIDLSRLQTLLA